MILIKFLLLTFVSSAFCCYCSDFSQGNELVAVNDLDTCSVLPWTGGAWQWNREPTVENGGIRFEPNAENVYEYSFRRQFDQRVGDNVIAVAVDVTDYNPKDANSDSIQVKIDDQTMEAVVAGPGLQWLNFSVPAVGVPTSRTLTFDVSVSNTKGKGEFFDIGSIRACPESLAQVPMPTTAAVATGAPTPAVAAPTPAPGQPPTPQPGNNGTPPPTNAAPTPPGPTPANGAPTPPGPTPGAAAPSPAAPTPQPDGLPSAPTAAAPTPDPNNINAPGPGSAIGNQPAGSDMTTVIVVIVLILLLILLLVCCFVVQRRRKQKNGAGASGEGTMNPMHENRLSSVDKRASSGSAANRGSSTRPRSRQYSRSHGSKPDRRSQRASRRASQNVSSSRQYGAVPGSQIDKPSEYSAVPSVPKTVPVTNKQYGGIPGVNKQYGGVPGSGKSSNVSNDYGGIPASTAGGIIYSSLGNVEEESGDESTISAPTTNTQYTALPAKDFLNVTWV